MGRDVLVPRVLAVFVVLVAEVDEHAIADCERGIRQCYEWAEDLADGGRAAMRGDDTHHTAASRSGAQTRPATARVGADAACTYEVACSRRTA